MNDKVHMFLAKASARKGNEFGYPKGERHAIIIFIRQKQGTDHDWETAESVAYDSKWGRVGI